jgi:hypothetical protein
MDRQFKPARMVQKHCFKMNKHLNLNSKHEEELVIIKSDNSINYRFKDTVVYESFDGVNEKLDTVYSYYRNDWKMLYNGKFELIRETDSKF